MTNRTEGLVVYLLFFMLILLGLLLVLQWQENHEEKVEPHLTPSSAGSLPPLLALAPCPLLPCRRDGSGCQPCKPGPIRCADVPVGRMSALRCPTY